MRETADTQHLTARHATQSSKSRACLDPCLAHGTRSTRTPCSGHVTLAGPYPGKHLDLAKSMALHRLVGSWSWHSHLRPQTGHLSRPLLCGLTDTTIASPSIVTPSTTVFTSARTYRRIFAMRPPPVAPDTFGEVESYGKGAPSGPVRGRSCQSYLFPTRELGKAVGGHPHKLPKSQIS